MILIETAVTFVVLFGILIYIHELGHFLAAKLFKFKVYEFAFGMPFGKKWRYWHDGETEYTVRAVMLGGFVGFTDADADEATREQQMEAFQAKPVYQRFLVVLAGPLASLLLGYVALAGYVAVQGVPSDAPSSKVFVMAGRPAAKAGLKTGEEIVQVEGKATSDWESVVKAIRATQGEPIHLSVRDTAGAAREVVVTPDVVQDGGKKIPQVGISPKLEFRPAAAGEIFPTAGRMTWIYFQELGKIFKSAKAVKENVGGPLGIAGAVKQAVEEGSLSRKIEMLGMLSLSLFAANLFLPIPVFDGGQLILFLVEALRRRPLSKDSQMKVVIVGWLMALALVALTTFNDILKFFHLG